MSITGDIRFGSNADIRQRQANVRFAPKSGHWNRLVTPAAIESGSDIELF